MTERQAGLMELGERLRARRHEARLDVPALAEHSRVSRSELEAFEAGGGGLGVAALMRVAAVLGVPATSFVHTRAPVVPASLEPSIVLKGPSAAWLAETDREALAAALRRARLFTEAGDLLGAPRNTDGFQPSEPPERDAYVAAYAEARKVRDLILRTGPLRSLARLLEDQFNILVLRYPFSDPRVMGAACRSGDARLVAVNASAHETARRFALAHELAHQLFDLSETGVLTDEIDDGRAWFDKSPREQRADAFAAMLLAPEEAVADQIGKPQMNMEYDEAKRIVESVRSHLGIGFKATAWHLHNLRYYARGVVDVLLLSEEPTAELVTGFEEDTRFDGLERRVLEAHAREIITRGRARELLGGVDPEELSGSL